MRLLHHCHPWSSLDRQSPHSCSTAMTSRKLHIAFLHLDLGIGGAERLVVDAALALQSRGHDVQILTAHHDPAHCFTETRDGTLRVTSLGDWLPRSIAGRCVALCAYVRMIYVAFYLAFFLRQKVDVVFCDQVSASVAVIRVLTNAKVLFYCHFPDQLLTERTTALKRFYRAPLDWFEEKTTGWAHVVLVNSNFTAGVFKSTFTSLNIEPQVLYPCVPFPSCPSPSEDDEDAQFEGCDTLYLSINRYERKKNIKLAIEALALLRNRVNDDQWSKIHLVVAGGYDHRVTENVEHLSELRQCTEDLHIADRVTFLKSISDIRKRLLLQRCTALMYTPDKEHFGIVPVEAMAAGRPVVAVASGGPMETVVDGVTGYLVDPVAEQFAEKMASFVGDRGKKLMDEMSKEAVDHVRRNFGFESFAGRLQNIVITLANLK